MNKRYAFFAIPMAALIIAAVIALRAPKQSVELENSGAAASATEKQSLPDSEQGSQNTASGASAAPASANDSPEIAQQQLVIEELTRSLAAAVAAREQAEANLEQSQVAVAELEKYVEAIEARGEDPADYADEGLAMFQPAFYEYEESFALLKKAESMEQSVREALAEAKDDLADLRRTRP